MQRLEQSSHLTPTQARTILAEEFRHIKRPLLKNAHSEDAIAGRLALIMVTSAMPGDGKTFCSINLAMSMAAEVDMSVLLVDGDVVRPDEVLRRLGLRAERGLLDLLTDENLKLSEVVLQTNVPKLLLLPTGKRNELSTELLASEAMDKLLMSLATEYPDLVVIFDSPPLLVTNEAKVLASRVGQVVMVVDGSSETPSVVAQAFAAVEQCPIVMSVLNKAPGTTAPLGYGYYGG
jgi:receptor protein-tyrosine kinase